YHGELIINHNIIMINKCIYSKFSEHFVRFLLKRICEFDDGRMQVLSKKQRFFELSLSSLV
ncbi:hypothetical protein, partial [Vibrio cholerae]